MTTIVRVSTRSGRVRIKADPAMRVTVTSTGDAVTVEIDGKPRRSDVIAMYTSFHDSAKRRRYLPGVSPEMEAAAVRSFLSGADVTRLGRSLAAVYEAMEAVRVRRDGED